MSQHECNPETCVTCRTALMDAWDKVHGAQAEAQARIDLAKEAELEHGRLLEKIIDLLTKTGEAGQDAVPVADLADVLKQEVPS